MNSQQLVGLLEALIPFSFGLYLALVAYRVLGKKPGVSLEYDAWHIRRQRQYKIGGFGLVAVGLGFAFLTLLKSDFQAWEWKTYYSSDRSFSIEMPGKPTENTKPLMGPLGPVEQYQLKTSQDDGAVSFVSSYSVDPPQILEIKDEDRLDGLMEIVMGKSKLLKQEKVFQGKVPGRELHFETPNSSHLILVRVFVAKTRVYRAIVVIPKGEKYLSQATRFLDSFKLAGEKNITASPD